MKIGETIDYFTRVYMVVDQKIMNGEKLDDESVMEKEAFMNKQTRIILVL